jgi:hypothetical protein
MTELELLTEQYKLQVELNELGAKAGEIQTRLNEIQATLKDRINEKIHSSNIASDSQHNG